MNQPTTLRSALLTVLLVGFVHLTAWAQPASVQGTVTDADTGDPLPGTTVLVVAPGASSMFTSSSGAATDGQGAYVITGVPAGSYELLVTYVGYDQYRQAFTLAAGERATMDVALAPDGVDLDLVIVSASRQAEKVLDAPASISVLNAAEIEAQATQSPALALRNTTGVDIAQTGADRYELVLRGFNNAFSGATYVMTDYRQANAPSLNANVYGIMPISNIDIERVEVVRGPGSALYGAGVDAGVVHFITKDPFRYPGTTVSVYGGQRALAGFNARHAGVVGENLGYKLTGFYSQVNDWEMNPNDPLDAEQLADDATGRERDYDMFKWNVNGALEYRFNPSTTLNLTGGYSMYTAIVLSGIGTLQADKYQYRYAQARLQSGGLFAQAYFNRNDAGHSFVYGSGQDVIDNSVVINAQAQYDLDLADGRERLIFGTDFKLTTPDTDETIYGRNEDDAQIAEYGAYVQSTTRVTPDLDLTLAGRLDYNNIIEQFQVSPRAALVYKLSPTSSVRATYNRAFSSPGNNSLFLDIPAAVQNFGDTPYSLVFQGRGSWQGFTFNNYRSTNAGAFSLPIPNLFGQPVPVDDIPLQPLYGLALGDETSGIVGLLLSDAPLPAPLDELTPPFRELIAGLLQSFLPGVQGGTAGAFGGLPDANGGYAPGNAPVDVDPLEQTTSQTFEVGYKGFLGGKVLFAADAYYTRQENFVGPLLLETPIVYLTDDIITDLTASLTPLVQNAVNESPLLAAFLQNLGLTPGEAAGLVATLMGTGGGVGPGLIGLPAAIVQPDQQVLGDRLPPGVDQAVGGMLAYRNFGNIEYWGIDLSAQLLLNDNLDLFGSVSVVSDDFFDEEEIEEPGSGLSVALNAPRFKVKGGFNAMLDNGLSFNASSRFVQGFPVRSGPYVGDVEDYFLIDLGVGYRFRNALSGLRFDVLAQNLLDNEHREFVGAPQIGRFTTARLTYGF